VSLGRSAAGLIELAGGSGRPAATATTATTAATAATATTASTASTASTNGIDTSAASDDRGSDVPSSVNDHEAKHSESELTAKKTRRAPLAREPSVEYGGTHEGPSYAQSRHASPRFRLRWRLGM
jgi:hypothetical protein